MRVIRGSGSFVPGGEVSLTVGNFDGVHRGHRELIRRTVGWARRVGGESVLLTFSPHPVRYFRPGARFYEITSDEEKASLIASLGIDVLVVEPFEGGVGEMAAGQFAREILAGRLAARHVVVGYDFTFGRNRSGTPAMLAREGRSLGFGVEVVPPVLRGGSIVSSTRIRDLILAGRVREAEDLLCRPYRLSGAVVRGAGRGVKLGFPTANLQVVQELIPLPGVYVVDAEVAGTLRRGVANVGFNPTFGENCLSVEVHILDFEGTLYGQEAGIRFRERVRDERKFKTAADLARQIARDVQFAREARFPGRPEPRRNRAGRGAPGGKG